MTTRQKLRLQLPHKNTKNTKILMAILALHYQKSADPPIATCHDFASNVHVT